MIASQNQIKTLILGDNLTVGSLPAEGVQVSPSNLGAGNVCLVDKAGRRVTLATSGWAANSGQYCIVQGQGSTLPLIKSDVIDFSDLRTTVTFKNYVADVEQVSYVGYAGGSTVVGSATIPDTPSVNTTFYGSLNFLDFNVSGNRQIKKEFMYGATTSDTKTTITDGLCLSAHNAIAKMIEKPYKVERVSSNAGTEALGADDTIVGNIYSKTLTVTEVGGVLPYAFVAGDYIRLGTGLTAPVYKIVSSTVVVATGGVLVLDQPLQESVSFSGVGVCEYITAADFEASNTGLKFTALAKQYIPQVMRGFEKVRFTIALDETSFTNTGITYVTAAVEGKGTTKQIQELERFSQMNQGNRYTSYNPPTTYINNTTSYDASSGGFNVFSITYYSNAKHGIVNNSEFPQQLIVAGITGTNTQFYTDGTAGTDNGLWNLLDVLDSDANLTAWT